VSSEDETARGGAISANVGIGMLDVLLLRSTLAGNIAMGPTVSGGAVNATSGTGGANVVGSTDVFPASRGRHPRL